MLGSNSNASSISSTALENLWPAWLLLLALSASTISAFERGINEGAPDPHDRPATLREESQRNSGWEKVFEERREWWSFKPPLKRPPPATRRTDWAKSPVDQFVLAGLEAKGLKPAPPASAEAWLRRVSFDLVGLPPTPDEVLSFLADSSPAAREKVLDRLLNSPHFGERWARHWMDLVRFAETYGHEQDFDIPHAWQYRDYLIRAFNQDVPYERFVREHIAGDLLSNPRLNPAQGFNESVIGTGFWYLHQATHAPVDPYQDEGDRIDNQIDVFSKTFLGLTVGCARCHDHKFDAISTGDYYSLSAFLRGSRQDTAYVDPNGKLETRVSSLETLRTESTPPLRRLIQQARGQGKPGIGEYLQAASILLTEHPTTNKLSWPIARVAAEHHLDPTFLEKWALELSLPEAKKSWHPLHSWLLAMERTTNSTAPNSTEKAASTNSKLVETKATHTPVPEIVYEPFPSLRWEEWFPSGQAFRSKPTALASWRATGGEIDFLRPGVIHSGALAGPLQGTLRSASFTITHENIHLRLAGTASQVRLIISRYALREFNPLLFESSFIDVNTGGAFRWYSISSGLGRHIGRSAYFELVDAGNGFLAMDQLVFSKSAQPPREPLELIWGSTHEPLPEMARHLERVVLDSLDNWIAGTNANPSLEMVSWLSQRGLIDWGSASTAIHALTKRLEDSTADWPAPTRVLAMADGTSETTHVLLRGDHKTPGPLTHPRFLEAVSGPSPLSVKKGSGRLELAEELVSERNPLTYRVIVNRVWAHLFGRGLVSTVDNFGSMGLPPTHPELLDYLSIAFREDGGSIKRLIRSLCLTQAYGMSSTPGDTAAETADPDNHWLHRQRLRRLEGEAIRDNLLAVSGRLNPTLFGPSVPTYFTPFMGDRMWVRKAGGPLDGEGRRSIYQETRRNFLSSMMLTFDLPLPDTTVGQRNQSNVPAQALTLMNDPLVKLQAESWAKDLLSRTDVSTDERIERMFLQALARRPSSVETTRLKEFVATQAGIQDSNSGETLTSLQLWSDVCHLMFMMKEFIYVP